MERFTRSYLMDASDVLAFLSDVGVLHVDSGVTTKGGLGVA